MRQDNTVLCPLGVKTPFNFPLSLSVLSILLLLLLLFPVLRA